MGRYVHPEVRPRLSKFCTELTGIEQSDVDRADPLQTVLDEFHEHLLEHDFVCVRADRVGNHRLFMICTDGPWDLRKFLFPECRRKRIMLHSYWERYADVRQSFADGFSTQRCGVSQM